MMNAIERSQTKTKHDTDKAVTRLFNITEDSLNALIYQLLQIRKQYLRYAVTSTSLAILRNKEWEP